MKILYEDRDLVAIEKPPLVPSQPDPSGDADAMTLTAEALAASARPSTLYPIHRLDRIVGGVMVFAKTKKSAAALSALVAGGGLSKTYLAVLDGAVPSSGVLEDYLIKDSLTSRAHSVPKERRGAKLARLSYETVATAMEGERVRTLVRVVLETGRFHQIRIQFSVRNAPILGDGKYGSRARCTCALFAHALTLPVRDGTRTVLALPPCESYPWSLFAEPISALGGSYDD